MDVTCHHSIFNWSHRPTWDSREDCPKPRVPGGGDCWGLPGGWLLPWVRHHYHPHLTEEDTEALMNKSLTEVAQSGMGRAVVQPQAVWPQSHLFLSTALYPGLATGIFLTSFLPPTAQNIANKIYFLLLRPFQKPLFLKGGDWRVSKEWNIVRTSGQIP